MADFADIASPPTPTKAGDLPFGKQGGGGFITGEDMILSLDRGTPIYTPKCYHPDYNNRDSRTVPLIFWETSYRVLGMEGLRV